eukprot:TRINITY_DN25194_c1_g1_i1.p1 TRINITY_DN25194_c1_g1~~TRINITY_DN25194_c1_g1_i1.p1  ORF type:complete len:668 (+),score=144.18 TRINITY_DN25194_c1_g1_i1:78-2081(+)
MSSEDQNEGDLRRDSLPLDNVERIKAIAHRRLNSAMPFFTRIHEAANNVSQKLQSASELLIDPDLRKKGANLLREGVKQGIEKGASALGKGIEQGRQTISNGPRSLQQILEHVQERLKQQHWERQLVLQKDEPVDVQIAHKLYEHAPQHLRTNFWLALIEKPELIPPLQKVYLKRTATHIATGYSLQDMSSSFSSNRNNSRNSNSNNNQQDKLNQKELSIDMKPLKESAQEQWDSLWEDIEVKEVDDKDGNGWEGDQELDMLINEKTENNKSTSGREESEVVHPLMSTPEPPEIPSQNGHLNNGSSPASNDENQVPVQEEEWEVVKDAEWDAQEQAYRTLPSTNRQPQGPLLTEEEIQQERAAMDPLMEAVFLRPEPETPPEYFDDAGEPIPYPPTSQYAWLLELRRQEEVEEVIRRDITRTFPRVPQFELINTQKALFNVLRAYAQQDPEVGYCQGMAFVVGILLMYLDQEPAFRLFCRLMGVGGEGGHLRKYYLPDLGGFKNALVKFEFLFAKHLPQLFEHMQQNGALAVLFAAPWFMTSFAASLPPAFSARILDVMFVMENDNVLHRMGISILQELETDLLELNDMESLCNYVKDEPGKWSTDRFRRVFRRVTYSIVSDADLELAEQFLQGENGEGFNVENSLSNEFSSEMMEVVQEKIGRAHV